MIQHYDMSDSYKHREASDRETSSRGRTYAQIDLRALKSNFQKVKAGLPQGLFLCPMVKANAYGHGSVRVTQALEEVGCRSVGVISVDEGREIRESYAENHESHKELQILVFGNFESCSFESIIKYNLTPVISQWHDLKLLIEYGEQQKLKSYKIHLKFNTGMNRLGFPCGDVKEVVSFLKNHSWIQVQGVMTHLANSGDVLVSEGLSRKQLQRFEKVASHFPPEVLRHVYNSAAFCALTVTGSELRFGLRPGLAIYGVRPEIQVEASVDWSELALEPVMSLRSRLVGIHHIKKGESVSYGPTWVADRDSVVGVMPIGYADGLTRRLSNNVEVSVCGEAVPQVGTICMDYSMIDLTGHSSTQNLCIGDEVLIFGKSSGSYLPVENCAKNSATIPYEILTAVGARVPRVYVG